MKNSIKNEDFLTLLKWVYSKEFSDKLMNLGKDPNVLESLVSEDGVRNLIDNMSFEFKYKQLMENAILNIGSNIIIDINTIEDFLVDVYHTYELVKTKKYMDHFVFMTENKIEGSNQKISDLAKDEFQKFVNIFEKCILECNFTTLDMKGIQKNMLTVMLPDLIADEKYEICAMIRDRLNENE